MATQPPPDTTISADAQERLDRAHMVWAFRLRQATDMEQTADRMRHEAEAALRRVIDEVAMTSDQEAAAEPLPEQLLRAYMQWAVRSKHATAAALEGDMAGADRMRREAEAELQRVKDEVAMTTDQRDSEPTKNWAGGGGAPASPPPRPRPPSKREQYAALATLLDQAASMSIDLPGIQRGGILTAHSQAVDMANTWAAAERHAPPCPICGPAGAGMEPVYLHLGTGTFELGLTGKHDQQLYRCQGAYHAGAPVILPGLKQPTEGSMNCVGQDGRQHTQSTGRHPEGGGPAGARRTPPHHAESHAPPGRPDALPHGGPDTARSPG